MFEWYLRAEPVLIPLQLLLVMIGMGATLEIKDFGQVVANPSGLGLGLLLQWVLVPLAGQAVIFGFRLDPGWAMGILIVSVTPGGAMSNLLTFLSRGHVALSVSVTLVTTIGCILTIPLTLRLFASAHLQDDFSFPAGRIVFEVFCFLLLPMGLGMLSRRWLPGWSKRISQVAVALSVLMVAIIALGALGSGRIRVGEYGVVPPLIILLFAVFLHLGAAELLRLLRRYDDEVTALAIEVSLRNGGVGLLLVPYFFKGRPEQGHVLFTVLFYTGMQLWIVLPLVFRHRMGKSALLMRPPRPRPGREDSILLP